MKETISEQENNNSLMNDVMSTLQKVNENDCIPNDQKDLINKKVLALCDLI